MCNLSQGIYNDGINVGMARGREEGMAKGRAEGKAEGKNENAVGVVKKLLSMGIPFEKALAVADIDRETYEKYRFEANEQ